MKAITELTDDELRAELAKFSYNTPPVTGTTRTILQKKLATFRSTKAAPPPNKIPTTATNKIPATTYSNKIPATSSPKIPTMTASPINIPITASPIKSPTTSTVRTSFGDIGIESSTSNSSSRPSFMNSFGGDKSIFGKDDNEEEEVDDHMESSRIISPRNRFRPSLGAEGIRGRNLMGKFNDSISKNNKPSPVEKFKNIGRTAWSFFSRPLGTSTPCSDTGYKYAGYTSAAANKYRRYSTGFGPGGMDARKRGAQSMFLPTFSPDTSRLIGCGIVFFIALIVTAYIYQAHTEAVLTALGKGKDATVGVFNFMCKYAIFPVIYVLVAALIIFAIYKIYDYNRRSKIEENRRVIELVECVTDIIFESGSAGIAEPHVRDLLMPPTKRKENEYKRWQQAARFINNEDSRIRTEIRLIDGTECNVWIWMGTRKQRWQGTAVAEGSPMTKVPEMALTHCLKLRGVDFSDNYTERDNLRKELLAKMEPIIPKHIGFLSNQVENVIYMMLETLDDAKGAFLAFHSQWFNGTMITVKYVRDERYRQRFPNALLNK